MKTFTEYLNEASDTQIEVNVDFQSKSDKESFTKKVSKEGLTVEFGKNKYAETATLSGAKNKIIKFLKSLGYSEDEMTIKK
jgi:hypothetical protein